ncbi:hypothetical protein BYT27DRAFT_7263399 [Phlegmacium glaucopus]|nr:hypothetical protein BYT27DRAFT_7263399 [Phlegmacium glaucopus]
MAHLATHPTQLTPNQIREELLDFNDQVRQGVEEGTIRGTMKHIARRLHGRETFAPCGRVEMQLFKALSLLASFSIYSLKLGISRKNEWPPDFVEWQRGTLRDYDCQEGKQAVPGPAAGPTRVVHPAPRHAALEAAPAPAPVTGPTPVVPQAPRPAAPQAAPRPAPAPAPALAPAPSSLTATITPVSRAPAPRPVGASTRVKAPPAARPAAQSGQQLAASIPRPARPQDAPPKASTSMQLAGPQYSKIIPSGLEAIHGRRPPPAPEPLSDVQGPSFGMLERDDETSSFSDMDEDVEPPAPARMGKNRRIPTRAGGRHDPPCGRCLKAERWCLKETGGGACFPCVKNKYRCKYSKGGIYRAGSESEEEPVGKKERQRQSSGKAAKKSTKKRPPKSKAVIEDDDEDEDDGHATQGPKATSRWVDITDLEPVAKSKRQVHPVHGTMQPARAAPTAAAIRHLGKMHCFPSYFTFTRLHVIPEASIGRLQGQLDQVAERVDQNVDATERLVETTEWLSQRLFIWFTRLDNQLDGLEGLLYDILDRLPMVPTAEDVPEVVPEVVCNSSGQPMDVDSGMEPVMRVADDRVTVPAAAAAPTPASPPIAPAAHPASVNIVNVPLNIALSSGTPSAPETPAAMDSVAAQGHSASPSAAGPISAALPVASPADAAPSSVKPTAIPGPPISAMMPAVLLQPPTPQTSQEALQAGPRTLHPPVARPQAEESMHSGSPITPAAGPQAADSTHSGSHIAPAAGPPESTLQPPRRPMTRSQSQSGGPPSPTTSDTSLIKRKADDEVQERAGKRRK